MLKLLEIIFFLYIEWTITEQVITVEVLAIAQSQKTMDYQIEVHFIFNLDAPAYNDDHNFGEIEFMLENERKKFKEAK